MSIQIYANNAKSTLSSAVGSTDLILTVSDTSTFPTLTGTDWTLITLELAGVVEIVKLTAPGKSGNTLIVDPSGRGWEGTTPLGFSIGARVEGRVTAGTLNNIISVGANNTSAAIATEVTNRNTAISTEASARLAANAGGTSDSMTATYTVFSPTLVNGYHLSVKIASPNTTTAPVFTPTLNGTPQTTRTIYKYVGGSVVALAVGDLQGVAELVYDSAGTRWILENPKLWPNATNAVNATNATNATTAGTCSGNSATATTATGLTPGTVIYDIGETRVAPTISGGVLTLSLSTANVFDVALNGTVTNFSFSGALASGIAHGFSLIFTANGTAYSVTWPASVRWANGIAPTLTTTNTKKDIFTFLTVNGGAAWLGFVSGQNL